MVRRLNTVKVVFISKWMQRFDAIPVIVKIHKLTITFIWKCKGQDICGNFFPNFLSFFLSFFLAVLGLLWCLLLSQSVGSRSHGLSSCGPQA